MERGRGRGETSEGVKKRMRENLEKNQHYPDEFSHFPELSRSMHSLQRTHPPSPGRFSEYSRPTRGETQTSATARGSTSFAGSSCACARRISLFGSSRRSSKIFARITTAPIWQGSKSTLKYCRSSGTRIWRVSKPTSMRLAATFPSCASPGFSPSFQTRRPPGSLSDSGTW